MSDIDAKYVGHLLEEIRDEVRAVHEMVAGQPTRGEFERLEQKVDKLGDDMETVKAAVGDLSRDLIEHVRQPSHSSGRVIRTRPSRF